MSADKSIGENIKRARKAAGLTQQQLADKIEKGFSTVQKYELGLVSPPLDILGKIAEALDFSLGYFIGFGIEKDYERMTESQNPAISDNHEENLKDSAAEFFNIFRELSPEGREDILSYADKILELHRLRKGKDK
jgi:transcriptional regulator with XRE-family HTH domain